MKYNIPELGFENFYLEDEFFHAYIKANLDEDSLKKYEPYFVSVGESAAKSSALALEADANEPELLKFNILGEQQNIIQYHASYQKLRANSYGKEIVSIKYQKDGLLGPAKNLRHLIGFLGGFLFSKADAGVYCPVCMTDSLAFVLEAYLENHDHPVVKDTLALLTTCDMSRLIEGSMFLTERQGGSDVGKNIVVAYQEDGKWKIKGHKWFCSNADAEAALVLARMPGGAAGTRGLGLFLFRKTVPDHNISSYEILRLKDKLGVKSMASGEIEFDGTEVYLLAGENHGFKMMAEMVNMSRTYNSVASLGIAKRAIDMARAWGDQRQAFGKSLAEQPLWKRQICELEAEFKGLFLLAFECIKFLDAGACGDERASGLFRLLTPVIKALCGKFGVFATSEAIELVGGNSYIEEFGMAKLLRDAQVLPIWEGTTNIQSLDLLRVLSKHPETFKYLDDFINESESRELEARWAPLKERFIQLKSQDITQMQLASRALVEDLGRVLCFKMFLKYQTSMKLNEDLKIFEKRTSFTQYLGVL